VYMGGWKVECERRKGRKKVSESSGRFFFFGGKRVN
jgi:hypothetical protein